MPQASPTSRVYVAGHTGLVGAAVVRRLRAAGYADIVVRPSSALDLRDPAATAAFFEAERPDAVVLAAAKVGGILANANEPVGFLEDNLAIALSVIGAAYRVGVQRLVFLGSSCIYPKHALQPLREDALLTGPLEPTNEGYAVAKIAGVKLCQAYRQQYGADFVSLMPTNLYGPGDSFDLNRSHVLPALVRKLHEAHETGAETVTLWGTGTPRREFMHSDDLADAVRFILECPRADLDRAAPDGLLNVGVGEDIAIRDVAELIREIVGSDARFEYDRSKPDGTPRKLLDVSRMTALGWSPRIGLREGIAETFAWYRAHHAS